MKKFIASLLALTLIFAFSASAFADEKSTTVTYSGPSAGYTWSIPGSITLAPNSARNNGQVTVTKFIGAAGQKLTIKLTSTTNNFRVRNGSTSFYLSYTAGTSNTATGLSAGSTILSVDAGTDLSSPSSSNFYVKLQAVGDTTAAVTGSYTDTITFTAAISGS